MRTSIQIQSRSFRYAARQSLADNETDPGPGIVFWECNRWKIKDLIMECQAIPVPPVHKGENTLAVSLRSIDPDLRTFLAPEL